MISVPGPGIEGRIAHVQHLHPADLHQVAVIVDAGVLGAVAQGKNGDPHAFAFDHVGQPVLRAVDVHAGAGGDELAAKLAHQADHLFRSIQLGGAAGLQEGAGERRLVVLVVAVADQGQVDAGEVAAGIAVVGDRACRQAAVDGIGLHHHAVDHDPGLAVADDHAGVGQPRDRDLGLQRAAQGEQKKGLSGPAIF
jgi:hypothetical protein